MNRDLVLLNGTVMDGSGVDEFRAAVHLHAGRIASLGSMDLPADAFMIDCAGMIIAPGFIDLHSHSDLHLLASREEKLRQGVTTELVGNCGFSAFPCGDHAEVVRSFANGILHGDQRWQWPDAAGYLKQAQDSALPVAGHSLVGHGTLRVSLCGMEQNALTAKQMQTLCSRLEDALHEGAVGLSTGLMYAPGSGASREELLALLRVVARHDRIHCTHMRDYGFHLLEAIDEQIELAEASGCRLQISHLQAVGKANRALNQRAIDKVEAAHARGIDIAFDCYPYTAGSTVMTQLLPQSALAGGNDALLERLADRQQRLAIAQAAQGQIANDWDELLISAIGSEQNARLLGRSIAEIAVERGVNAMELVFQLLEEENCCVNILEFNQSEENLRTNLAHPLSSVISDGFYVDGRPHPRLCGTFPSFLRRSIENPQWLSLPAAIHKITAQPARRMGLSNQGLLRVGYEADLTIFDPQTLGSAASYSNPTLAPTGIRMVIRSGRIRFAQDHTGLYSLPLVQ